MKKVVAQRMVQFGQAGHAGDYAPIAITEIAKGYANAPSPPSRSSPPSNSGARHPSTRATSHHCGVAL